MEYLTSDLGLSAYLSIKFTLKRIQKIEGDPKRKSFVFDNTPDIEKEVEKYWNNTALVEPTQYFQALKGLKSRIYNENI